VDGGDARGLEVGPPEGGEFGGAPGVEAEAREGGHCGRALGVQAQTREEERRQQWCS
jgi:hypothetical protein